MARLLTSGFESQIQSTLTANDGESDQGGTVSRTVGTVSFDTSNARSGAACLSTTAVSSYYQFAPTLVLDRTYWFRTYFRTSGNPAGSQSIFVVNLNVLSAAFIQILSNSTLRLFDSNSAALFTTAALTANTWYRLEMELMVPTAGNGTVAFNLDGVEQYRSTSVDVNNSVATPLWRVGATSGTTFSQTFLFDDVAVNDNQGSDQNTFPGEGKIVVLKPTSQNSNTGFTGGGGGTTNLHDANDNFPPTGVVSPGTNASQNGSATSNTTDNYQLNLGAYTTAVASGGGGMASNAIVRVAQAYMRQGNSSTTSRSGAITGVSNPALTEVVQGSGTTAAGTEPTGWTTKRTAIAYNPSVTLGTSPVVKFRKGTASTDRIMCDQMGLLVEYVTPTAVNGPALSLVWEVNNDRQARRFDGVDDTISTGIGACNLTGAYTIAALVRRTTNVGTSIVSNINTVPQNAVTLGWNSSQQPTISGQGQTQRVATTLTVPGDSWVILVVTKASGTTTPRCHLWDGTTWTHADFNGTQGDPVTQAGGNIIFASNILAVTAIDIAVVAEWNGQALTDAQCAELEDNTRTRDWLLNSGGAPAGLWQFNDSSV